MKNKVRISFEDQPEPTDPREISDFLYLLTGTLVAAQELESLLNKKLDSENIDVLREELLKLGPTKWNNYFSIRTQDIELKKISHNSPLELVILVSSGCLSLITFAIVLSGGKIKASLPPGIKLEAELPPLGDGLRKLKAALGLDSPDRNLGYGIKSITIKLNRTERKHLLTEIKGIGGFQHFLKRLQSKLNKTTGEITLSVEDLDRIDSYRKNPSAGGFQSRYEKIFKRHLESQTIEVDLDSTETEHPPRD